MNKIRGFEMISSQQAIKDVGSDEILKENIQLPVRATIGSAGYDVFAPFDIVLKPQCEEKIPTYLKAYMQDGEVLMCYPRSGLGFGYYCRLANTVGVIDKDYYNNEKNEGHIWVKIRNESTNKIMKIKKGEAFCQGIFIPFLLADGDTFEYGNVRKGGFGHTTENNSEVLGCEQSIISTTRRKWIREN